MSLPRSAVIGRRLWARHPCDIPVQCRAGNGPSILLSGRIRNLSPRGLALFLDRCLEPGAVVTVEVLSPGAELLPPLTVRVSHATACPSGSWLIGCTFPRKLGRTALYSLLAHDTGK